MVNKPTTMANHDVIRSIRTNFAKTSQPICCVTHSGASLMNHAYSYTCINWLFIIISSVAYMHFNLQCMHG